MGRKDDSADQIGRQNLNDMLNAIIENQEYVTPAEERAFIASHLPNQNKTYKSNRSLGGAVVGGIIRAVTLPAIIIAERLKK